MSKKKIIKSAKDGRFASKEDLEEYPEFTYEQSVEVKPRRKKESDAPQVPDGEIGFERGGIVGE